MNLKVSVSTSPVIKIDIAQYVMPVYQYTCICDEKPSNTRRRIHSERTRIILFTLRLGFLVENPRNHPKTKRQNVFRGLAIDRVTMQTATLGQMWFM